MKTGITLGDKERRGMRMLEVAVGVASGATDLDRLIQINLRDGPTPGFDLPHWWHRRFL